MGVTIRFGFDCVRISQIPTICQGQSNGNAPRDVLYLLQYQQGLLVVAGGLYIYISVGFSALLVSTDRAMREPLHSGTGKRLAPRLLCIYPMLVVYTAVVAGQTLKGVMMKKFVQRAWLMMAVLLSGGGVSAQRLELHVQNPGDLPKMIDDVGYMGFSDLKISGKLNGTDMLRIREMVGIEVNGDETVGHVSSLDLSEAQIVGGGDSYFYDRINGEFFYTSDNEFPSHLFYDCRNLKSIILPSSVTSIGESAFEGCSSLTSIVIPESVTSIGGSAFEGCSSLTSIVIPESVTFIGIAAFQGCRGLTSIVLPESVTTIGDEAFKGCSSLTSMVLPKSVTSIGKSAFEGCSSLTSMVLPKSVTSIEYSAFKGCSSLTSIVLPESVTIIEYSAFYNCSGLKEIYSKASVPLNVEFNTFSSVDKGKCILYVPTGSYASYRLAEEWGSFEHIVEKDMSDIDAVKSVRPVDVATETERYSIGGIRIDKPERGLNVVRMSDGTVRKVMVK